jgi:hypothetical protein
VLSAGRLSVELPTASRSKCNSLSPSNTKWQERRSWSRSVVKTEHGFLVGQFNVNRIHGSVEWIPRAEDSEVDLGFAAITKQDGMPRRVRAYQYDEIVRVWEELTGRQDAEESARSIERYFAWLPAFIPDFIVDDLVGDACETIIRHRYAGALYWLTIIQTCVWIVLQTFGHARAMGSGKRKSKRRRRGG